MPDKQKTLFMIAGLTAVTLAVFWQVRNFEFINYDDIIYVSENTHILTGFAWDNIVWVFTHEHVGNWHPLTGLSHILDCQLFGLNPGWHHLVNLLFHITNTLLLFTVLKKMTGAFWQSMFVAALFAVHPLHVESVAWISERKDVLSTFFWLLTMIAYFHYIKNPKTGTYILTLLLFVLGLMAKPMLVTLPFVFLLLDYWPLNRLEIKGRGQTFARLIWEKMPFFILSAVSSVITFVVQKITGAVAPIEQFPLTHRLANILISYVKYTGKMFWPSKLAAFYPYPPNLPPWILILAAAVMLMAITCAVIYWGKKYKYLPAGWFWFLGTLVPVIGLVQVGNQAMADRYTYIPLIGLFIVVAWGANDLLLHWKYRKIILSALSIAVVSVLALCAAIQTSYWRDSITLFEHALKVTSGNYVAYNNIGFAFLEQNKAEEAINLFHRSLQIKHDNVEAYNNLGMAYGKLGRDREAIEACEQAIKIDPHYPEAYNNLAVIYARLGRYQEATETYKQAIKIKPDNARMYFNLGITYGQLGRIQDEIAAYKKAISIESNFAEVYYTLGLACSKLGRYQEAMEAYRRAVKIKPNWAEAQNNLGSIYEALGLTQTAMEAYEQAIKIKPDYADAYNNLANTYGKFGRYQEAIEAYKQAVKIKPDDARLQFNLGVTYLSAGDKQAAAKQYEIVKTLDAELANKFAGFIK